MLKQIFLFVLSAVIFGSGTFARAQETQWVDPNTLKQSDFQWNSLTPEQMADAKQLQEALSEVDPSSLEQWVDDFRRDSDPNAEIALWKHIANVYTAATQGRALSLAYKKDVFGLLNTCSMAPREEVLAHASLKILSDQEANDIMDLYYVDGVQPSPLMLEKK